MKPFNELTEEEIFEYCSNNTIEEIKALPADYHEQAIRYSLSRMLMDYNVNNPLKTEICIEPDCCCGLSTLLMPWVTKIYQDECEGCIYVWIDGVNDWTEIEQFTIEEQFQLLEELSNYNI